MAVKKEKLMTLQSPDTYKSLGIAMKWRVRQVSNGRAFLVPYYDARDVQRVFDAVCEPQNWNNEPLNINGKLFMQIGVNIEGEGWVYKSDVGTESNIEKTKGEASDALKRAAVVWGVFRHVYDTDEITLAVNGKTPVTANGKPLLTGQQLSAYCNGLNTEMGCLMRIYTAFKPEFDAHPEALALLRGLKEFMGGIKE